MVSGLEETLQWWCVTKIACYLLLLFPLFCVTEFFFCCNSLVTVTERYIFYKWSTVSVSKLTITREKTEHILYHRVLTLWTTADTDPRGTAVGQTTWQAYIWSWGRDCLLSKPPAATCAFTTQNMSCKKTASHSDSFIILHICYRCPFVCSHAPYLHGYDIFCETQPHVSSFV